MKREINIRVTYIIDDKCSIVPNEDVKETVEESMNEYFGWDEGYEGLDVSVIDSEVN